MLSEASRMLLCTCWAEGDTQVYPLTEAVLLMARIYDSLVRVLPALFHTDSLLKHKCSVAGSQTHRRRRWRS